MKSVPLLFSALGGAAGVVLLQRLRPEKAHLPRHLRRQQCQRWTTHGGAWSMEQPDGNEPHFVYRRQFGRFRQIGAGRSYHHRFYGRSRNLTLRRPSQSAVQRGFSRGGAGCLPGLFGRHRCGRLRVAGQAQQQLVGIGPPGPNRLPGSALPRAGRTPGSDHPGVHQWQPENHRH